ncbi:MAG: homoserine kinase [Bacteroidetes bacterium]|nr:homoserine kinase [Bacteroidota bacterium]
MKEIRLRVPATSANVGPGYDIFAMALEQPYDDIYMCLNDTGKITIEIEGDCQNIPVEVRDNTAGLALMELYKRYGLNCGMHIRILKNMTSGSGLGSTGASASACVYGANLLFGLNISDNEMIDLARMGEIASGGSPHADNVAAALLGGFTLVMSYEPMEVLKLEIPAFPVVLAIIRKSQRTTRGFITYDIGEKKLKEQIARCSTVIHALHKWDIELFGKAISTDHIAEPVRSAAIPGYRETKKKALDAGAWGCTISGGGSSVIAFCEKNKQEEIAAILEAGFSGNPNFVKVIKSFTSNLGVREL